MASGPYGGNKRPADDDADTAESQSDDEHQGGGQGGGGGGGAGDNTSSKQAQSAPGEPMSCPYRKRNRGRFNVRDHLVCTKVFNDLSIVKLVCQYALDGRLGVCGLLTVYINTQVACERVPPERIHVQMVRPFWVLVLPKR